MTRYSGWYIAAVVFGSVAWSSSIAEDANYDESRVPVFELPDPLVMEDGREVTSAEMWRSERRPEIRRLFEQHVFGRLPEISVETRVVHHSRATTVDGLAIREQQTIYFTADNDGPSIDVLIYTPASANNPVPAFLGLNFSGNHTVDSDPSIRLPTSWMRNDKDLNLTENRALESSRGKKSHRWDVKQIVGRGYGLVTAYYGDIDPDFDDGFRNGIHQLEKSAAPRANDEGGSISAWAWGLSRILDSLQDHPRIDADRVAVIGHSRLGKTALWAGATDERFRLVISNNSGCGGAALSRRRFGETVARINTVFPHWFCLAHRQYNDNENELPVDHHQLIALIAPRPVYVASAEEDRWADPRGEMLSVYHAGPVYRLLGKKGLESTDLPDINGPVMRDVAYHIRSGKHDVTSFDWTKYLDFADRHLK